MKNKVTTEAIEHTASCLFSKILDIGLPKGECDFRLLINEKTVGYMITEKYGNHIILSAFIGDKSIYTEDAAMDRVYKHDREESIMLSFCKHLATVLYNLEVGSVNIIRF